MNEPNAARILQTIFEMMVLKQCNIYNQPTSYEFSEGFLCESHIHRARIHNSTVSHGDFEYVGTTHSHYKTFEYILGRVGNIHEFH